MEVAITIFMTLLNMRGASFAGSWEVVLTFFKAVPLLVLPFIALWFWNIAYLTPFNPHRLPWFSALNTASLLTFWGFIGVESALASASVIEHPQKTVPKAVVVGTFLVAVIYLFNSLGMMGVVPNEALAGSPAPYVKATYMMFGRGWDLVVGVIAFIACVGTLNAWVLTSGQIALEGAKERLFPPLLGKVNRYQAPYVSLFLAMSCTIPLLALTFSPNLLAQLEKVIDVSVTAFLLVYLASIVAYFRLAKLRGHRSLPSLVYSIGALLFSLWILVFVPWKTLFLALLFPLTGLIVYWRQRQYL
jgi:APA family basic amino acid/polyamine antiporter